MGNASSRELSSDKINQICDGEHDNEWTRVVCTSDNGLSPHTKNVNPIWQLLRGWFMFVCSVAARISLVVANLPVKWHVIQKMITKGASVKRYLVNIWWQCNRICAHRSRSSQNLFKGEVNGRPSSVGQSKSKVKYYVLRSQLGCTFVLYHWTGISHN